MTRTIEIAGTHVSVDEQGTRGPLVALLHSSGMTSRQWKRLAERLAPTHRVLLPDLIGHGASGAWPAGAPFHYTLDVLAIERLVDSLGEPVHLVGHSYGGLLSLNVALHRPRAIASIALVEPVAFGVMHTPEDGAAMRSIDAMPYAVPSLPATREAAEAWLTWFVDYWNGPGAFAALPERMRASFLATVEICHGGVYSLLTDRTPAVVWSTLTMPTLVVRGERSPAEARRVVEILSQAIAGATLRDVPGAGHMSPVTHADLVADFVEAHLASAIAR